MDVQLSQSLLNIGMKENARGMHIMKTLIEK